MAAPISTTDSDSDPAAAARRWISIHVFYASDADPMLVECVAPLVRRLRERVLITRYFYIRYWLEGRHVRLRLLPAPGVPAAAVEAEVEAEVAAFLLRRPAPSNPAHAAPADGASEHHRQLFLAEYGRQRWDSTYGPTGTMPVRENNSYHYIAYEPEYLRYGGPAGLDLAEWHFETSSDVVLRLLATATGRTPTVRLGLSAHLGLALCLAFLGDVGRAAEFLASYRDFWESTYRYGGAAMHAHYDKAYRRMADRLQRRIGELRSTIDGVPGVRTDRTALELDWLAHCRQLRARLVELTTSGAIELYHRGSAATVTDPAVVLPAVLRSYVHMTNNRLGMTIGHEAYVAHVLRAALLDHVPD
jgi:thiopeptide-type bacteriocin biosynthesis protein